MTRSPELFTRLPSHWTSARLKFLASIRYGLGQPPQEADGGLPLIRATNVQRGRIVSDGLVFVDPDDVPDSRNARLRAGEIIVVRSGAYTGDSAIVTDDYHGAIAGYDMVVSPMSSIEPRFLAFTLLSQPVLRDQIYLHRLRAAQPHLNAADLGDTVIPLPPSTEQAAIADYLAERTQRIDLLIADKEHLLDLAEEHRQAAIARLVTQGWGQPDELVDSGVPWIGRVPDHWEVVRTRFVARLESGHTPSRQHPEYWIPEECTVPWFTLADVWQLREDRQEYLGDTAEKVSPVGLANSSARLLPVETVVLSRTASVGFSGIMPRPMATSQDFVNWVCGPRIRPEYLLYVFRAMRSEFKRLTMGSTHQTIYMPDVRNFRTPLPPLAEQDAIVAAVRDETSRYNELVEKLRRQIAGLREYRQTLISAAVTGQVEVLAHELEAAPT